MYTFLLAEEVNTLQGLYSPVVRNSGKFQWIPADMVEQCNSDMHQLLAEDIASAFPLPVLDSLEIFPNNLPEEQLI